MKDYSAMSDFEINKAVALQLYPNMNVVSPQDVGVVAVGASASHVVVIMGSNAMWFNYCNNPADAWPIIADNKINIDHRESIKAGVMATKSGNKEIYAVDSNPLRAAMIVYLQIMEQKS